MTTATPSPAPGPWQAWKDFWFRPTDPTTLGFIRICTGLLVLYCHLTYSLDLQSFFGKNGWYASSYIDRERHEFPTFLGPFWEWEATEGPARLSEYPHRRKALMRFLRGLPAGQAERAQALAYLNRANALNNPEDFKAAVRYIHNMGTRPELMNDFLTALQGGKVEARMVVIGDGKEAGGRPVRDVTADYIQATPNFLLALPPEEKVRVAGEVRAFAAALPRPQQGNLASERDRDYVCHHFIDTEPLFRKALIEFMNTLPDDPAAREKKLEYLEYWNNDPKVAHMIGYPIFSVWFHVTDPTEMALVHALTLVLIVLFTAGLFTRVTSVLVWVAVLGYIHRTQQILFGMDTMMNILLIYLMVGNSGAALSADRLIARYRAARASLRRTGTIDPATRAFLACPPPSRGAGFGIRLIQVHFCIIYMAAGLSKLKGAAWWNGQAFWDVISNPEFTPMYFEWYRAALRWSASVKPAYYVMISSAVWVTLFVEISLPFLVWTRLRWFVRFLATLMHAIIGVIMGLNLFELFMIVMLLAYLPDRVIRDRFRGGPELPRLRLRFNPQEPTHARAAALALAADVDNQLTPVPDKAATEPSVVGPDGQTSTGADGTTALFRDLRLPAVFRIVLWIPGARGLVTRRLFPTKPA